MTTTPPSGGDGGVPTAAVPHWRLLLGGAALAAAAVAVAASWDVPQAPPGRPAATAVPSSSDAPASTGASERHQDVSTPATAATEPSSENADPVDDRDQILGAAAAALDVWAAFAATGDLEPLADHFDPAGPQYRQLAAEASTIGPDGTVYAVTLDQPAVTGDGDSRVVRGRVTWSREGEPVEEYDWVIQMRRADDRAWRVWTVTAD